MEYFTKPWKVDWKSAHKASGSIRADECPECKKLFGSRRIVVAWSADTTHVVHKTCADIYVIALNAVARTRWDAQEASIQEAIACAREERKTQRGDWNDYVASEVDEDDREFHSICRSAQAKIEHGTRELAKFAKDLTSEGTDPFYVMEWSEKYFESAAKVHVAVVEVREAFDHGVTLEELRSSVQHNVHRKARYCAGRSTMPTSNLMNDHLLQELSILHDTLTTNVFGGY